ncbi:uncharacterized protein At2g33490-like [Impatiens glandulifera]|uniref:uncharacterized protein At2g33490-like n=1 Tax=Impatiens glandulifera TaxID=253017 RepID=UPI001FB0B26C|nr:uncharacterized protein At2g33490-like [Impatiens glandulifera]
MRTSLKKLKGFSISASTKRNHLAGDTKPPLQPHYDELSQASQDVKEMKEFYDSLISAAAATSNSAYEFSESLNEMGTCLLEKTAVNDDEERGRVLLMLGKVQFELQKLADNYRSHVVKTIQNPSDSLITQLETLEDMKRQCDEKRRTYQEMLSSYRENGRFKGNNRTESISYKQLEAARDEYEEETNLFAFRLKSLKGAQSHSLLTQASRHHAAQLCFFRRALKCLQLIEPYVKRIAEEQHIVYQFRELEDDEDDNEASYMEEDSIDNDGKSNYDSDDVELSFSYGKLDEKKEKDMTTVSSSPTKSMELESTVHPSPTLGVVEVVKEKLESKRGLRLPIAVCRENKIISQSAPILSTKKGDHAPERSAQLQQSSSTKKKIHSYVLPTPEKPKNSDPRPFFGRDVKNYLHSSPLQQKKMEEERAPSVPTTNHRTSSPFSTPLLPLEEKLMRPHIGTYNNNNNNNTEVERNKFRRMAFSGPLNKPSSLVNGPVFLKGKPLLFSGPLFNKSPTSSPPKLSPGSSPTRISSPIISELHELPRPPPTHHHGQQLVHSGPLPSIRKQGSPIANKLSGLKMALPPPLMLPPPPIPPQTVPRSFSVPSNVKRVVSSEEARIGTDLSSPPLTPIVLPIIIHATASAT